MSSRLPRAWESWAVERSLENVALQNKEVLLYIRETGRLPPGTGALRLRLEWYNLITIPPGSRRWGGVRLTPRAEKLLEEVR